MTVKAVEPVEATRELLREKRTEKESLEAGLRALMADRQREAVAGRDTRCLREQIADAEAEIEDQVAQISDLERQLREQEALRLHRERHAVVASIYRDDLRFLRARHALLVKQAEMRAALAALQGIVDEIDERRTGAHNGFGIDDYRRLRLIVDAQRRHLLQPHPDDYIESLGGVSSLGGDSPAEVAADMTRIEALAAAAEAEGRPPQAEEAR